MRTSANSDTRAVQLHRMIFRLHFYAGLIVAPFVLILAVTGAIYLFNTEIDDALHPFWRFAHTQGAHLPPEKMVDGALSEFPGAKPTRIDLPTAPNRTAVVFLTPQAGEPLRVYVDPVSGTALGSFVYERTIVGFADKMHGSLLLGDAGDLIVELAACWAILLVLTGLYLWWPRTPNRIMGVFVPRLLKGRALFRDLHAVGGVWTSALILFLLVTGLPWSSNWGGNFERLVANVGLGYPASYRTHINHAAIASTPPATLKETTPGIPWTLEPAPAPHSHHLQAGRAIDVGAAGRIFASKGLTTAYRLIYPRDAHDVYTAYTYPDQPEGQRTIHIDQYSGAVLNDVRFADYGAAAKAVEWGVQLHMGNYFGVPNQIMMLVAAVGAATLSVTGLVMWILRRKKGLGAPEPFASKGVIWGFAAFLLALGILLPAMGVTILFVLILERLCLRRIPMARQWLVLAP